MGQIRLLVIDGMSVIRRIYEAVGGEHTEERAEDTVMSCVGSFNRMLREVDPTHVLCVLDASGNNWRHTVYPQYKANREPCPEVLTARLADIASYLSDQGIMTIAKKGYEADDLIGAVVRRVKSLCEEVIIATQDKDMLQLVCDNVVVRHHFAKESKNERVICDAEYIKERYGLFPSQIRDYLALMGDTADNVPGVFGIGTAKARDLLRAHYSVSGVLAIADELLEEFGDIEAAAKNGKEIGPPSLVRALLKGRDDLVLSYELVGLKDVDLGLNMKAIRYLPPDNRDTTTPRRAGMMRY